MSLEKKAWAVVYHDLTKLNWLSRAAEELGYVLVTKDAAEECKGRQAKHHAGLPALEAPLRNPRNPVSDILAKPATDIFVYADSHQTSLIPQPQEQPTDSSPAVLPLSQVLTPDSTRGVTSSMHNPDNAMLDDPTNQSQGSAEVVVIPPALPALSPIPLLLGLAEMLNTLQANLMTSFTNQITALSARIDVQDEVIKITGQAKKTAAKGKATARIAKPSHNSEPGPSLLGLTPPVPPMGMDGDAVPIPIGPAVAHALPVPNPLPTPVPAPVQQPRGPRALLPEQARWAGVDDC
ncbi:hypothetical protein BJY52DRAFT_1225145 [Lactarius psammicola]|nr:hypothetical protein BJY52DRAFT_1225145 [Lactarius psammicola]